ncbi:MAG: hypothetical protein A2V88_14735 [Elusimicrobia bacterium RBG_16_66_12]|nr:MAG: hypothetical protein A2V88_14735 [Elusimicrobia bacterium RBG_16_66_12]
MLSFFSACSPVYVARSASGHAGLLWRRRSIAKTISDPKTSAELKKKLETVVAVRRYAFDTLALKSSRDYETWTPVKGSVLTWLVSASERLRLRSYEFRFPLAGSFPYKGHFRKDLAEREAAELEMKGYDATVSGAAAYNTPLPLSDPLPSSLLSYGEADLAETLIHELAHGTVYFKDRTEFDEAVATWIGRRGAEAFLRERFGEDSAEMKDWKEGLTGQKRRDDLYRELKDKLAALYDGPADPTEKMEKRKAAFEWARGEALIRGVKLAEPINNASVLAHSLYDPDLAPFDAIFEKNGRDWPKTLAAFKAL